MVKLNSVRHRSWHIPGVLAVSCLMLSTPVSAQEVSASAGRAFAPGVLTTIPPDIDRAEAIHLHDMLAIRTNPQLQWAPNTIPQSRTLYAMAEQTPFVQNVWCLEFTFKPLRMLEVDIPQPSGKMQRKLIWYLVYRVRNVGAGISGEVQPDGEFTTTDQATNEIRFYPEFVLVSRDRGANGDPVAKEYLDRVIPAALEPIRRRERIPGELRTSVEMSQQPLRVEEGRIQRGEWGVAMWEDVDPEIDFFSVYVGGLTNAHRWVDAPDEFQPGDVPGKGRAFEEKKLQLNFWRPGDQYEENEREIRFGVPEEKASLYDSREGVAYRWQYR